MTVLELFAISGIYILLALQTYVLFQTWMAIRQLDTNTSYQLQSIWIMLRDKS